MDQEFSVLAIYRCTLVDSTHSLVAIIQKIAKRFFRSSDPFSNVWAFLPCCSSTLMLLIQDLASAKAHPAPRKVEAATSKPLGDLLFTFLETPHILTHATKNLSCVHVEVAASDTMAFPSRGA